MNRKNLLIIAFALLLVALGNWLTEEGVKQVDKHLVSDPQLQQDYYLKELSITALNEQGELQHRLQATQLNHFAQNEQTQLQQPTLEVYKQNKIEWRVSAERGELLQQQDQLILEGGVKLVQPADTSSLQLSTSRLRIQPEQGIADTEQAVTLTQAGNRIDAVGMRIEQQGQRLLLLSQVRGHYENLAP